MPSSAGGGAPELKPMEELVAGEFADVAFSAVICGGVGGLPDRMLCQVCGLLNLAE